MVALQISPKIESLYGLGRQAKKFKGFVWNFATFTRFPFGQFSTENSQTWSGSLINIRNSPQCPHVSAIVFHRVATTGSAVWLWLFLAIIITMSL